MGNSRLDGSVTSRKALYVGGDNPVVVETRISEGEGDDENCRRPRLGVKGIFFFPLFFFFFTSACSSLQYSEHFRIYCLARVERETIESYPVLRWRPGKRARGIYAYARTVARTKMFAQPAINNADGINAHVVRQLRRRRRRWQQ